MNKHLITKKKAVHYVLSTLSLKTICVKALRGERLPLGTTHPFCSDHQLGLPHFPCSKCYPMALINIKDFSPILMLFNKCNLNIN